MMQETEETGAKTMEMLDEQGEQLNRIEEGIERPLIYGYLMGPIYESYGGA